MEEATELILRAVAFARNHNVRRLLINGTQLDAVEPLTVLERLDFSERLAREAYAPMKIALVTKPDVIDAQRIGMIVAANRGLHAYVFTSETEARAWLAGSRSWQRIRRPRSRSDGQDRAVASAPHPLQVHP